MRGLKEERREGGGYVGGLQRVFEKEVVQSVC